jgi:hypothetical protein
MICSVHKNTDTYLLIFRPNLPHGQRHLVSSQLFGLVFRFKNDAIILDQDVHKLSQPTATAGHLPEFSQGKPSKTTS